MSKSYEAAAWTGLTPDTKNADVRDAQRPNDGGPKPLEPMHFNERAINWGNVIFLAPMVFAIWMVSDAGAIDLVWLVMAVAACFLLVSIVLTAWRSRPGRKPTITLDADGFHMPYQYKDPIPWSKIGRIESSHGRWLRWTSVFFDRHHPVITLAPWPLSMLPESKRKASVPMVIISSWNMAVDMDELIAELIRFRDNYCAA
ncbi:MAG: hypothetical protein AAGK17_02660 [Pseudomonadota bacterium]